MFQTETRCICSVNSDHSCCVKYCFSFLSFCSAFSLLFSTFSALIAMYSADVPSNVCIQWPFSLKSVHKWSHQTYLRCCYLGPCLILLHCHVLREPVTDLQNAFKLLTLFICCTLRNKSKKAVTGPVPFQNFYFYTFVPKWSILVHGHFKKRNCLNDSFCTLFPLTFFSLHFSPSFFSLANKWFTRPLTCVFSVLDSCFNTVGLYCRANISSADGI